MTKTSKKKGWFTLPVGLVLTVLILFGAYSGYWVWMSGEVLKGAHDWVDDQRARGNTVEYSDLSISGYPYRFVLEAKDPVIEDLELDSQWWGETLQLIAMSWNLNHIIVRTPGENLIELPTGDRVTLFPSDKSAASLIFEDGHLRRFGMEFPRLDGALQTGEAFEVSDLTLSLTPMPETPENLRFSLMSGEGTLPRLIPGAEFLGQALNEFVLWVEVENFYPLVENDIDEIDWKIDENKVEVRRAQIDMGPLDLSTRASFFLDRDNNPDGTLGVYLERGDDLKDALREAGLLTGETEQIINTLALISERGGFVTVKLEDRKATYLGQTLFEY